ncbi:hypothetical protein E2C01_047231 [Portunus trituberculatus]|uniref:Endonuclease/exonuclease/phosphatase domain-containing protein n=1 Tax=Portunus trituberculatus TaxID=210409 RepID=A0A5B7G0K5_PORTR|nr:hypothetical protein [Portunus trituberculatus]
MVRNGLLTYIHNSLPHRLLRTSTNPEITFQLLEITLGNGAIQVCNVYSAPARLSPALLVPPTVRGVVYMGDFSSRHPDLGNRFGFSNRNGLHLLSYTRRHHMTHWDTGGTTNLREGTLDYGLSTGCTSPSHKSSITLPPTPGHSTLTFKRQGKKFNVLVFFFQGNPIPELPERYRESRDALVALLECVTTESWQRFTESINQETSMSSMWHLIRQVVKKTPPPMARYHTPAAYAQQLVDTWSEQSS